MLLNSMSPKDTLSYAWDETFDTEEFKTRVSNYNEGILSNLEGELGASTTRSM
jgi:hypothetical protein